MIIALAIVFVFIIVPSIAITGVLVGIYVERKAWNKLIAEGKLPKPYQLIQLEVLVDVRQAQALQNSEN